MIRLMRQRFGILLIDRTEIILRIYETTTKEWKLLHYKSVVIPSLPPSQRLQERMIIEAISEMLILEETQHIAEWKICARLVPQPILHAISSAIGLEVEDLPLLREQELLCKGMFTELW